MSDLRKVVDYLFEHRAHDLPPSTLADMFGRLIWCLDDNGAELLVIRAEWLHSDDRAKIEIALAMDEVFPCNSRAEMVSLFDDITAKRPALQAACDAWLQAWDKQHP